MITTCNAMRCEVIPGVIGVGTHFVHLAWWSEPTASHRSCSVGSPPTLGASFCDISLTSLTSLGSSRSLGVWMRGRCLLGSPEPIGLRAPGLGPPGDPPGRGGPPVQGAGPGPGYGRPPSGGPDRQAHRSPGWTPLRGHPPKWPKNGPFSGGGVQSPGGVGGLRPLT